MCIGLSPLAVLVTAPWAQPQARGCVPTQLGVLGSWTWTRQNPWRPKAWTPGPWSHLHVCHPFASFGASRVLIRCPRMGKGGPRGAGHPAQVTVSLCLPAPPCWCGTPRDSPAEGREIWSPHAGCWEGTVSSARGDAVAMSNSILAAGSHIPAHGPLAGDTPTLRAARGVPTRNVAARGLGLLPAVMGAVSCWLPSPRSPPGQGHPRAIPSAGIRLFPKETFPWPCCSSS